MCGEGLAAFLAYFGPFSGLVSTISSRIEDEESDRTFENFRFLLVAVNSVGLLFLANCNYPLL